ncbi:MAG: hypothetical protein HY314_07710 [Acidobacteria bacterium]|nr:hypothetical protein [Acidobacteriota bacterium]
MKSRNLIASMLLVLLCAGPLLANPSSSSPQPVTKTSAVASSTEPAQGVDVDTLFEALQAILASRASQYSAHIDTPQAKMFQLGQASAVIAPVTELKLTDLGLLGLLEVGGVFTIKGAQLPPGSYRMELGGTLQQMLLHLRDSFGNRVVSIPVEFNSNMTFQPSGGQLGASGFRDRFPASPLRVLGPNININFNLTRTAPYIQNLTTCIGFIIPFATGAFTIRFCF